MPLQGLRIDQTPAQIGLNITRAGMRINMPRGQLVINDQKTELSIEKQLPTFKIDRQKLGNETGLKVPSEFTKGFRDAGRQAAYNAIGQYKSDGNFLANHKIQGNNIQLLATNKANARLRPKQANIGLMPKSIPDLQWTKGYVNISWSKPQLNIDYNRSGSPLADVSLSPTHSVEVYLRNKPSFQVSVMDVNNSPGVYI